MVTVCNNGVNAAVHNSQLVYTFLSTPLEFDLCTQQETKLSTIQQLPGLSVFKQSSVHTIQIFLSRQQLPHHCSGLIRQAGVHWGMCHSNWEPCPAIGGVPVNRSPDHSAADTLSICGRPACQQVVTLIRQLFDFFLLMCRWIRHLKCPRAYQMAQKLKISQGSKTWTNTHSLQNLASMNRVHSVPWQFTHPGYATASQGGSQEACKHSK